MKGQKPKLWQKLKRTEIMTVLKNGLEAGAVLVLVEIAAVAAEIVADMAPETEMASGHSVVAAWTS